MTTTTRITLLDPEEDADMRDRYVAIYAVTLDNPSPCEHCDTDIEPGLAALVSLDADLAYPISMHLRHFDRTDPDYVPYVAHLEL